MMKEKNTKDQVINYLSDAKANVNIGYNPIMDALEDFILIATIKYTPITIKQTSYFKENYHK